jgi:hypothetical protein
MRELENFRKFLQENNQKNTHKILLYLNDISLKKFKTIPTFKSMLYPNQLAGLKVGDNELIVNNTTWGKLERMEGPGGYNVKKIE